MKKLLVIITIVAIAACNKDESFTPVKELRGTYKRIDYAANETSEGKYNVYTFTEIPGQDSSLMVRHSFTKRTEKGGIIAFVLDVTGLDKWFDKDPVIQIEYYEQGIMQLTLIDDVSGYYEGIISYEKKNCHF